VPAAPPLVTHHGGAEELPAQPRFYFDPGVPASWPVAERILTSLPELAEWVPADLGGDPDPDWDDLAARAAALGLLAPRRPAAWPPATGVALHALTYARGLGKTVAFGQALLRQVYAGGRDLGDPDTVAIAGAAAEIHPRALLAGIETAGVRRTLAQATAAARQAGVGAGPAVVWPDGRVRTGADCLAAPA
jgi:2-hydroxychromene-2-carboxylate isomerase